MSEQTERLTEDEQAELASIMGRLFLPDFTEREVAIVTATASAVLAKVRGQGATLTARCEALEAENKQLRSAMRDAEQLYDEGESRCEALAAERDAAVRLNDHTDQEVITLRSRCQQMSDEFQQAADAVEGGPDRSIKWAVYRAVAVRLASLLPAGHADH